MKKHPFESVPSPEKGPAEQPVETDKLWGRYSKLAELEKQGERERKEGKGKK